MNKTISVFVIFMLISLLNFGQESEKSKVYFGFNAGIGQMSNGYRLTPDKYDFLYSEGDLHFSAGTYFSVFVTERFRPRLEFRYSEMKYQFNWSDTYSGFDKTDTKLNALNLNLNFDFLLLNGNKFQLFASPGFISEFIVGDQSRTYKTDGTNTLNKYTVITDQYPDANTGANFSVIVKYKLNKYLGFTLTPGYNYYFKEFVSDNDKKYSKSFLNFGIEYTF
ncbi:outer membrane beta-barrel protein [Maribellus comscasis]|uniref:Outer membrane beta-barrel protein n=1 Tax=Maribellus comscasis TaxID=2681766 RepID=A0A6I6K9B8_9BACT|nr:outer membrane beta-barrel protein [Maribellus comscasis]QGY46674.1 outer membrane beta-barrel protein [Maribellus comscasis]